MMVMAKIMTTAATVAMVKIRITMAIREKEKNTYHGFNDRQQLDMGAVQIFRPLATTARLGMYRQAALHFPE